MGGDWPFIVGWFLRQHGKFDVIHDLVDDTVAKYFIPTLQTLFLLTHLHKI
jgi:hypothetical protein